MYRKSLLLLAAAAFGSMYLPLSAQAPPSEFWPQWRGPPGQRRLAHGEAAGRVERDEERALEGRAFPARGASTPVVWGDRVYVLTAVPVGRHRRAGAQHRFAGDGARPQDGKIVWQHTAREEAPHEGTHQEFGTMASSSAVTDGQT